MCDMVALARLSGIVMRRDFAIKSCNKVSRQDRLARPHATADNQRQTKLFTLPILSFCAETLIRISLSARTAII